jgi:hypothetical protein
VRRHASDTERLIEEGLSRYGAGDVEGALDAWERALDVEPDNPQAASYVEYVKANWDVLTGVPDGDDAAQDYGFSDEPDYHIEIQPGQLRPGEGAPLHIDPADQGWFLHDETVRNGVSDDANTLELDADAPELSLEGDDDEPEISLSQEPEPEPDPESDEPELSLEADEPEMSLEADEPQLSLEGDEPELSLEADEPGEPETVSKRVKPVGEADDDGELEDETNDGTLEDETSEFRGLYQPERSTQDFDSPTKEFEARRAEFEAKRNEQTPPFGTETTPTPGFGPEATPVGFSNQTTDIRKRELGFVQPRAPHDELKVNLRTPGPKVPMPARPAPGSTPPRAAVEPPRPAEPAPPPAPVEPATAPPVENEASFADLIESLPSPRAPLATTRDLPDSRRPPAPSPMADTQRPVAHTRPPATAETLKPTGQTRPPAVPIGAADTLKPPSATRPVEEPRGASPSRPPDIAGLGSAPTRELGTRDLDMLPPKPQTGSTTQKLPPMGAQGSQPGQTSTTQKLPDDLPAPVLGAATRDLGLRPGGAPGAAKPAPPPSAAIEDTAPLDPLDVKSAQILKQVDSEAPPNETVDDRTRRRISALLDRALAWNGINEFEKAVMAAELSLSEDPNSAVAQKLVQRNRDTIMSVFQNYIGDLQRVPALAKPLHQLGNASISPRAAFLLSRVDGQLSIDELLDVSGMPRLEAYRYLCQLFLRGILR